MAAAPKEPHERLKLARERAGFDSAKSAARRFSWSEDTYAQHENGTRGLVRSVKRYARAFKVSEAWLLTGTGPGPGEHAEALRFLAEAYLDLPEEYRRRLLESVETHLRAAGKKLPHRPDELGHRRQGDEQPE